MRRLILGVAAILPGALGGMSAAALSAVAVAAAAPARPATATAPASPAAAAAAPAPAEAATAPAPAAAQQTRAQKIAELTTDLGYGADIRHVDAAIAPLTAQVAPADPTWNPTHRHWAAVRGLVKTALRDDAERRFGEAEMSIREGAERAMDGGVTGEDLDAALAFFRGGSGRRFKDLQDALTDLSIEISFDNDDDASGMSVENLDTRKRILESWLPIAFIRVFFPAQTAERTVDAAYEKFSKLRGRELDALAERYGGDLPQFESFIHSAAFGRITDVQRQAAQSTPAPNLVAFFATEAARHGAEWHAAYSAP